MTTARPSQREIQNVPGVKVSGRQQVMPGTAPRRSPTVQPRSVAGRCVCSAVRCSRSSPHKMRPSSARPSREYKGSALLPAGGESGQRGAHPGAPGRERYGKIATFGHRSAAAWRKALPPKVLKCRTSFNEKVRFSDQYRSILVSHVAISRPAHHALGNDASQLLSSTFTRPPLAPALPAAR